MHDSTAQLSADQTWEEREEGSTVFLLSSFASALDRLPREALATMSIVIYLRHSSVWWYALGFTVSNSLVTKQMTIKDRRRIPDFPEQ